MTKLLEPATLGDIAATLEQSDLLSGSIDGLHTKLRAGFVGDGAVIDHQFNTIDVAVVVKTDMVTAKYFRHYERQQPGEME